MTTVKKIYAKLQREAIYMARDISYILGFNRSFFKDARGCRILVYHGICRRYHTRFNPIFLTAKTFEQHLKLYEKYFNVVSMDDYYRQNLSNNKFNICLTFDDGFANNHKYLLPLLEKYKLPATFFITAIRDAGYDVLWNDFLGIVSKYGPKTIIYKNEPYYKGKYNKYTSVISGISLNEKLHCAGFDEKADMMKTLYPLVPFKENGVEADYWLQMTSEQIKELAASRFATIGAHGYYHNDLARVSITDAAKEMALSKQYLENMIGKQVSSIAFPYGTYNKAVVNEAKKAGYTQLLGTDFHVDDEWPDPTMRERFTVNPFISPVNQMYATIKRCYER